MRIGIVVDSACDVPREFIEREQVTILPVTVQIGQAVMADMRNEEAALNFLTGDTAAQAHSAQAWVDALARQVEAVAPENHDNYTAIALTLGTPYIPPPVQGEAQASQNLLFEAFGI